MKRKHDQKVRFFYIIYRIVYQCYVNDDNYYRHRYFLSSIFREFYIFNNDKWQQIPHELSIKKTILSDTAFQTIKFTRTIAISLSARAPVTGCPRGINSGALAQPGAFVSRS